MKILGILFFTIIASIANGQEYVIKHPPDYYKTTNDVIYGAGGNFPGGQEEFKKFVERNLKWTYNPDSLQGRVIVSLIIERNGKLTHLKVVRGINKYFNKEAIRLLHKSPRWIPGTIQDTCVRAQHTVAIDFSK